MPEPIPTVRRHGTRRGYDLGCRCFPCSIACSRYLEAWRAHGPTRVPAVEVCAHLRALVDSGWTRVGIARAAGIGATTPTSILIGRTRRRSSSTHPPTVNAGTAAAIMALPVLTPDGIRDHLRTLVTSGLTVEQIAAEAGLTARTVAHHLVGTRDEVRQRTAAALAAVEPAPEPLVLDVGPLLAAVAGRPLSATDRTALSRARRSGRISEAIADRIAIAAGVGPLPLIYPWGEAA